MKPISLQGRYRTRGGDPVRILCVAAEGRQPVVGIHGGDGKFNVGQQDSSLDLIEVTPPPDTPLQAAARKVVAVWNKSDANILGDLLAPMAELEGAINGQ